LYHRVIVISLGQPEPETRSLADVTLSATAFKVTCNSDNPLLVHENWPSKVTASKPNGAISKLPRPASTYKIIKINPKKRKNVVPEPETEP